MKTITVRWKCIDFGSNTYRIFDRVANIQREDVSLNSGDISDPYTISSDDDDQGSIVITMPGGTTVGHQFLKNGDVETL